jgi:hypothetical protein
MLALIVAMGGASRRLTVAFESVVQNDPHSDGRPCRETPNPNSLNPSLFSGGQDKAIATRLGQLPLAVADDKIAHPRTRTLHLGFETQSASRAKLLSLQAWFVRLQL